MPNQSSAEYSDEYSFTEFSSQPFYRKVNSRLVDMSGVFNQHKIIDLGCGTGGITKLILDRLTGTKETVIYAVDHSSSALKSAVEELGGAKKPPSDSSMPRSRTWHRRSTSRSMR